jgi:hypothetical protein
MLLLDKSLSAWGSPDFKAILKQEIECIDAEQLPLQQGLTIGNYAIADHLTVMINSISETDDHIHVTAGISYQSVICGCSCMDDPTPVNENNEYCVVRLDIDKYTSATAISLVID